MWLCASRPPSLRFPIASPDCYRTTSSLTLAGRQNHDLSATGPILIVDFLFGVVFGQQGV
jgi:hypothetical protein